MVDKNLVVELSKRIQLTRDDHKYKMRRPKKKIKVNRFAYNIEFSPDTQLMFNELCELSAFIRRHSELTNKDLSELLKTKFFAFKTLRECEKKMPNLFEELREMGAEYVTIRLAQWEECRVSRI